MPHAAGLAAAVEREFGVAMLLREGHDGILEMTVDGQVVYDNGSRCGVLPKVGEVLALVEKHKGYPRRAPTERTDATSTAAGETSERSGGACCPGASSCCPGGADSPRDEDGAGR